MLKPEPLAELAWLVARCGRLFTHRCAHQQAPAASASCISHLLAHPPAAWGVSSNGWHRSSHSVALIHQAHPQLGQATSGMHPGAGTLCRSLATASLPDKRRQRREGSEASGPKVTTSAPWPWIDESRPFVLPKWVGLGKPPPISIHQAISSVKEDVSRSASQLPQHFTLSGRKQRVQPSTRDSVELNLTFLTDARRSDQIVRGMVALPHGTGKTRRVAVFAKGAAAEAAKQQGADVIGDEELIQKIIETEGEVIDFEVIIATPEFAKPLAKAGKVLGPKGLMPNAKMGTLTDDVAAAVKEMQAGKVEFRVGRDKQLQILLGKVNFTDEALLANTAALIEALLQLRPKSLPGSGIQGYISGAYVKSSHTSALRVDPLSFQALLKPDVPPEQAAGEQQAPGK